MRNIQPRPNVGFKFHAVLVVNSAHLASARRAGQRALAADLLGARQLQERRRPQNEKESGWRMKPVDEMKVPAAAQGPRGVHDAMDDWDEEAADAAAAGARPALRRPDELFDLFARYGCRDFRDIGHKAIYVANAFRTLEVIGWQHAEPVLRSLAFALLKHDGENPAKDDLDARPARAQERRARSQACRARLGRRQARRRR